MRRRYRTSPVPQDTKEIIQFKHIDHEQVDEKQQAALRAKFKENLAKQNAESKERSTMRVTSAAEEQQNRAESILEHQTEVEVEFHVEGETAWLRCNRSGETVSQFNLQRAQELTRARCTGRTCASSVASKGSTRRVRTRRRTTRRWTR